MQALIFLFVALVGHSVWAQGFELPGIKSPFAQKKIIRISGGRTPESDFGPGAPAVRTQQSNFNLTIPYQIAEEENLRFSYSDTRLNFDPEVSGLPNLAAVEFGLGYSRPLTPNSNWGLSAKFGSASDRIFSGPDVTATNITATWVRPKEDDGQWIWLLNYSNNRPFWNEIPLPGFAYIYSPNSEFQGVFGFPFAFFQWKFRPNWGWNVVSVLPWHLKTSVSYDLLPFTPITAGLDISHQTFFRAERADRAERIFFEERKLFIGLRSPLTKWLMADLEIGRAYQRRAFEAVEYKVDPSVVRSIQPQSYAKLGFMFFWD